MSGCERWVGENGGLKIRPAMVSPDYATDASGQARHFGEQAKGRTPRGRPSAHPLTPRATVSNRDFVVWNIFACRPPLGCGGFC
jgi:hypothetical protein